MKYDDICSFVKAKVGTSNWVVAYRKNERIIRKYGKDVVVIHPLTYRKLMTQYDNQ